MKKRILQSESTRKNVSKETLDGYIKTLKKWWIAKLFIAKKTPTKKNVVEMAWCWQRSILKRKAFDLM